MTDKTLTCRDCGSEFIFSVGEQEFYKEKGFEMSQQDVYLVEELRKNKIEDNFRLLQGCSLYYSLFCCLNNEG